MNMGLNGTQSTLTEQRLSPEEKGFDYSTLDSEIKLVVQQRTSEIKSLMRRTAQDIIDIGLKLIEVKQQLGHGNFEAWLKSEFDWGEWTARKFIQVARKFKSVNFTDLSIATSALYLLASSDTPEGACKETLERAIQGDVISYTEAKGIITRHQKAAMPKPSEVVTFDVPVETVIRDSLTPSEADLVSQIVESQSATITQQSEYKLCEEETEALTHSQLRNHSHAIVSATDSADHPPKDQAKIDTQSLFEVGDLIYFTDLEQQESKLLGEVAEVKEVTATDVTIKISFKCSKKA